MAHQIEVIDLTHLPPADGILSQREQAYYKTLRFPKRQTEWLGGRIALKQLVARVLGITDLIQIEVLPQDSGKPQLLVGGKTAPVAYSITHSHGLAVAAAGAESTFLGIDLEKIEPRIEAWKNDFFHPNELTGKGDAFLTALWTQKEALVKLLGTGLSLRSNEVCCIHGKPRFAGRALEIYESLGAPQITVVTEHWPGDFMFSVAEAERAIDSPNPKE